MKKYNGEKAIISLTSWPARIDTVHKTIENLMEVCNQKRDFLICLTLSEEEFPNREGDLPESLLKWIDKIKILWVKKNVKAFKKVFYALLRYPNLPVISADDDCLYTENYAEKLYQSWVNCERVHQIHGYAVDKGSWPCQFPCGPATIYPPGCFHLFGTQCLSDKILESANDDLYYGALAYYLRIPFVCVSERKPFTFHDENEPIHANAQQLIAARNICLSEVKRQLGGKV